MELLFRLMREVPPALFTRWKLRSWVGLVGLIACVLAAYVEKLALQSRLESPDPEAITSFANTFGSGWAMIVLGVVALGLGRAISSERLVHAVVIFGVAGLFGWLVSSIGAFILAESRPRDGGAMHFFAWGGHGVSGHACAAAVLLVTVGGTLLRGSNKATRVLVTLALCAWAVFIAWSRVRMNMHFVWNVMLGAAVGAYVTGVTVSTAHRLDQA